MPVLPGTIEREEWYPMEAQLRTGSAQEVRDAYDNFRLAYADVAINVRVFRDMRDGGAEPGDELAKPLAAAREARDRAQRALGELERLMRDELGSL
jgi:hypothetical protein